MILHDMVEKLNPSLSIKSRSTSQIMGYKKRISQILKPKRKKPIIYLVLGGLVHHGLCITPFL